MADWTGIEQRMREALVHGSKEWGWRAPQMIVEFMKLGLPEKLDGWWLNIGCHTGEEAFALAALGAHVVAVDMNEEHLNVAERRRDELGMRDKIVLMQEEWPVLHKDGDYNGCLCAGVIYHSWQPVNVLRAIHRVLKPEARLYLETAHYPDIYTNPAIYMPPHHPRHFDGQKAKMVPNMAALDAMLVEARFAYKRVKHYMHQRVIVVATPA